MSEADDELFGLKSSRTGKYLHSKSADEMFDDLGLWLEHENGIEFEVKNDDDKVIKINKERKEIACFNYYDGFEWITLEELQAINEKVKELGWLDE